MICQSYNAKLSDFGLAKDGPTGDKSHVSTRVMGTYGYAAPEYLATGMILEPWISLFAIILSKHRKISKTTHLSDTHRLT